MGATIRDLFVKLGVKADTASLAKFDKGLASVKTGMQDLTRVAVVAAAAAAAVTVAVVAGTIANAAHADSLRKTALAMGITGEEWQKLTFVADRAGVSAEEMRVGLQALRRNMLDASMGAGEAVAAFDEFGITVTNADGSLKSQTQLLKELADAYGEMDDPVRRAALLTKIFGRNGAAMGPLLAEGAEGIEELMQRAEELGLVMSEEQLMASEALTDAMTDLNGVFQGLRNTLFQSLVPTFTLLINQFIEFFLANRELINQRIDEWMGRLAGFIDATAAAGVKLLDFFGGLGVVLASALAAGSALLAGFLSVKVLFPVISIISGLVTILSALAGIMGVSLATAAAAAVLVFAQLLIVLGQLLLIGALVVLWVQDFYTFLNGGDSVIGRFLESLGLTSRAMETFWAAIAAGRDLGSAFLELAAAVVNAFGALASAIWEHAAPAVTLLWDVFMGFISWLGGSAFDRLDGWISKITSVADLLREVAAIINDLSGVESSVSVGVDRASGAGAGADASRGSGVNNVSQTNSIIIEGAGDPNAVGAVVVDQISGLLNQTRAAFAGGDL